MSEGPSIDREFQPVIDPSKNVDKLVDLAVKRLDDLRELDSRWRDRVDRMQIDHIWEMRRAESDRIDAILEAAAVNVQRAADVQSGVAERLAGQVSGSAEVVRLALRAEVEPIQKDIADLRRVQYEGVGSKDQKTERRQGISSVTAVIAAMSGLFVLTLMMIAIGLTVYSLTRPRTDSQPTPSVVCTDTYHPAPCP